MSLLSDFLLKQGVVCAAVTPEDYRKDHEAPGPDYAAPMYDLEKMYPKDVYTGRGHEYANSPEERDGLYAVSRTHNKPWAPITIYRAVPKDISRAKINVGDWVTTSRAYAKEHGEAHLGGHGAYKILKLIAHARDLYTAGDSLAEWGYYPRPATPEEERQVHAIRDNSARERLQRAANGEKLISINKYPDDAYYGKEPEFFQKMLDDEYQATTAVDTIPDTTDITAAVNYQDDTDYATEHTELTKLGLIFGQPQSKNDGIQVTYKGHTLQIRPEPKEVELSPAVPASRGRKHVPASVKNVPGYAVTGITPNGNVTHVLRAEDADKWLRGLKAHWDSKQ